MRAASSGCKPNDGWRTAKEGRHPRRVAPFAASRADLKFPVRMKTAARSTCDTLSP